MPGASEPRPEARGRRITAARPPGTPAGNCQGRLSGSRSGGRPRPAACHCQMEAAGHRPETACRHRGPARSLTVTRDRRPGRARDHPVTTAAALPPSRCLTGSSESAGPLRLIRTRIRRPPAPPQPVQTLTLSPGGGGGGGRRRVSSGEHLLEFTRKSSPSPVAGSSAASES